MSCLDSEPGVFPCSNMRVANCQKVRIYTCGMVGYWNHGQGTKLHPISLHFLGCTTISIPYQFSM